MKKNIKLIIFVFVCLFSLKMPVKALCTGSTGHVSLYSNNILDRLYIRSYQALGAKNNSQGPYGVSVFALTLDNRKSVNYYAYGIDPGYKFSGGEVCCNPVSDSKYTKGTRAGLIHLLKGAGNAITLQGSNSTVAASNDMAIKFFSMVNNMSNSGNTNMGTGLYQVTSYLSYITTLMNDGRRQYGDDKEKVNRYVAERISKSKFAGYTINSFILGNKANEVSSYAYNLYLKANEIKVVEDKKIGSGSYAVQDIRIYGSDGRISCDANYVTLDIEINSTVKDYKITVNDDPLIDTRISGNKLFISKNRLFRNAQCNSGDITITIKVEYTGGSDVDLYLCNTLSHSGQQIISYVGSEGVISGGNSNKKTYSGAFTLPSKCIPTSYKKKCVTGGGLRCEGYTNVDIKASGNNCCDENAETNESTVTDSVDGKTVDDPLDINDLFDYDPELNDNSIKSVVKCNTQADTSAPDFQTVPIQNSDLGTMKQFCQMYCMERTKIITPPPVEVTAGRYFELDFSKFEIQEERQCRVAVDLSSFFNAYVNVILLEIEAFNKFQENAAHYYLYNSIGGNTRTHEEFKLKSYCRLRPWKQVFKQGTDRCGNPTAVLYKSTTCNVNNPYKGSKSSSGTNPTSYCTVEYDKLRYNTLKSADNFKYVKSELSTDVISPDGKYGYGAPSSYISIEIPRTTYSPTFGNYLDSGAGDFAFFSTNISNDQCAGKSAYEVGGSPNCYFSDGSSIPKVVHSTGYDSTCVQKFGECYSGCHYSFDVTNDHNTAERNFYDCDFDKKDLVMYNYIVGAANFPDFDSRMQNYKKEMDSSRKTYEGLVDELKRLESSMTECLFFFDTGFYGGSKLEVNHYDASKLETSFEYDQIYSTSSGNMTVLTNHSTQLLHGCTVTMENVKNHTSEGFGQSESISLLGFHQNTLSFDYQTEQWSQYSAGKLPFGTALSKIINKLRGKADIDSFTQGRFPKYVIKDATYKVHCDFDNNVNYYTLVPGGYSDLTPSTGNYVYHDKLLTSYLTTYGGKHEILYHISGLGSQIARQFDSNFERGVTCSGKSSGAYNAPASCWFNVTQKLVTTGTCTGVASSANFQDVCRVTCAGDGTCDSIFNFMFKTVDPGNLFPTELPAYNDKHGWGKNWLTSTGASVREKIETDAKADLTYSSSNIMYSFQLDPKTITEIKNYNVSRYDDGGYNDFDLTCNCGTNGSLACTRCVSTFLSNLAQTDSIVTINGTYRSDNKIWGLSENIQHYRNINTNWNKSNEPAKSRF